MNFACLHSGFRCQYAARYTTLARAVSCYGTSCAGPHSRQARAPARANDSVMRLGQNATVPLGRREKIGLAGFEVDRKRYVFLDDQPFPLDFAEYVGDAYDCIQRRAIFARECA